MILLLLKSLNLHNFSIIGNKMFLDGKEFQVISGEMHPARIPHQYWEHRILMAKALGLNTITVTDVWAEHEKVQGTLGFQSPQLNITNFIQIAAHHNLYCILKPGPFTSGDFPLGGIPSFLLKDKNVELRSTKSKLYLDAAAAYIQAYSKNVKQLMTYFQGNILFIHIENQYYGAQKFEQEYLTFLKTQFEINELKGPFATSDVPYDITKEKYSNNTIIGLTGNVTGVQTAIVANINNNTPIYVSALYTNNMVNNKDKTFYNSTNYNVTFYVKYCLEHHIGFNLAPVAGGSGLTGSHQFGGLVKQQTTSYYHDAIITEDGKKGPWYDEIRKLIETYTKSKPVDPPTPIKLQNISQFVVNKVAGLTDQFKNSFNTTTPDFIEQWNQSSGLINYKVRIPVGQGGVLELKNLKDRAVIYLNAKYIGIIDASKSNIYTLDLPQVDAPGELDIQVEAFNYQSFGFNTINNDRKGISEVLFKNVTLQNFETTRFDVLNFNIKNFVKTDNYKSKKGGLFQAQFNANMNEDVYIDLHDFVKGYVFANDHFVGQYWNVGPQQALYVPGVWLNNKNNDLIIIDIEKTTNGSVLGCDALGNGQCPK